MEGYKNRQMEIGRTANLITDMTMAGATEDERASAIEYSRVLLDNKSTPKDIAKSKEKNGITTLLKKYPRGNLCRIDRYSRPDRPGSETRAASRDHVRETTGEGKKI